MAPFKLKFSRMSKSNPSTRSNSAESPPGDGEVELLGTARAAAPGDCAVPPAILEAAAEADAAAATAGPGDGRLDAAADVQVPASPPPSYEHVLQETKLKEHESCVTSPVEPLAVVRGQEIMHKSSKELYKAVAKQFGITCKMSDQCRCLDCQSRYFDCEYDQNEQEKTDGGLGAGGVVEEKRTSDNRYY